MVVTDANVDSQSAIVVLVHSASILAFSPSLSPTVYVSTAVAVARASLVFLSTSWPLDVVISLARIAEAKLVPRLASARTITKARSLRQDEKKTACGVSAFARTRTSELREERIVQEAPWIRRITCPFLPEDDPLHPEHAPLHR
jgi:hypothetical protein